MKNRKENTDELIESLFTHFKNVLNGEDLKYLQMLSQKYHQLEHENVLFKFIYKAAKIIDNVTEREDFLCNIQSFSFFLLLKDYPQYLNQAHTDNKIPWKLLFIWTNAQYNSFHDRLIKNIPNITIQQQKQLCLFRIGLSNDKIHTFCKRVLNLYELRKLGY